MVFGSYGDLGIQKGHLEKGSGAKGSGRKGYCNGAIRVARGVIIGVLNS